MTEQTQTAANPKTQQKTTCTHPLHARMTVQVRHHPFDNAYPTEMCLACGHIFHLQPVKGLEKSLSPDEIEGFEWFIPRLHEREALDLYKAVPSGYRWITVHPHKDDTERGYPVLIQEHPDGTGHVVGGVGGALNGLHLTRLKPQAQMDEERRTRAQQRTADRRQVRADMTPDQRAMQQQQGQKLKSMKDAILDRKIELAQEAGLIDRAPELTAEEKQGLSDEQIDKATRARRQKVGGAVDQMFKQMKDEIHAENPLEAHRLREELSAVTGKALHESFASVFGSSAGQRIEDLLGETYNSLVMPEVTRGVLPVVQDVPAVAEAKGLTEEIRQRAADAAKDLVAKIAVRRGHAKDVDDYHQKMDAAREGAAKRLEGNKQVRALRDQLQVAAPEEVAKRKDLLAELGTLKAKEKAINAAQRQLMDWDPRVDSALPTGVAMVEGKLAGVTPLTREDVERQLQSDRDDLGRFQATDALLREVYQDELPRQKAFGSAVRDSHYGTLALIAHDLTGGEFGIDKLTTDRLGVQGAATALVEYLRATKSPEDFEAAKQALLSYHQTTQVELQQKAVQASKDAHAEVQSLQEQLRPVPEAGAPMTQQDELNRLHNQTLDMKIATAAGEGRQALAEALGHMEALAALNWATGAAGAASDAAGESPAPTGDVALPLGKVGPDKAVELAYASGLKEGEYRHVSDGVNDFLEVPRANLARLYREPDPEVGRRLGIMRELVGGARDKDGWLPAGVVDKTGDYVEPENRIRPINFAHALKLTPDMSQDDVNQAVRDWVMASSMENPIDALRQKGLRPDFKVGLFSGMGPEQRRALEPKFNQAWQATFPPNVPTKDLIEKIEGGQEEWADEWLKTHGITDRQKNMSIANDEGTVKAIERILGAHPELAAAYAPLRRDYEMANQVRDTLEEYFYQNHHEGPRPGSSEDMERRRRTLVDTLNQRLAAVDQRQSGSGATMSMFDDEPAAQSPALSREQVETRLAEIAQEKAGLKEDVKRGEKHQRRISAIDAVLGEQGYMGAQQRHEDLDKAEAELSGQKELLSDGKKKASKVSGAKIKEHAQRNLSELDRKRWNLSEERDKIAMDLAELNPQVSRWEQLSAEEGDSSQPSTLLGRKHELDEDDWAGRLRAGQIPGQKVSLGKVELAPDYEPSLEEIGETSPWAEFVEAHRGGGGDPTTKAYQNIQAQMRQQFNALFSAEYETAMGRELPVSPQKMPHPEAWHVATLPPAQRAEIMAARLAGNQAEYARLRSRAGGKFAKESHEGAIVEKHQAQQEKQELQQHKLTDVEHTSVVGRYRSALPPKVEEQLAGADGAFRQASHSFLAARGKPEGRVSMPKKPLSMDGEHVNQQRAVRAIEELHRVGINQKVGSGKTMVGMGAFTHLHSQGKVHAGLFVVPTAAIGAFTADKAKYIDSRYRMFAETGADAEERRAAYGNDKHQMVLVTQEGLREDLSWALAQHRFDGNVEAAKEWARGADPQALHEALHEATDKQGWNRFDYLMMDEAQKTLGRRGKQDSLLAKLTDAYTRDTPYLAYATADPVKNDISEFYSFLNKIDPQRFPLGKQAEDEFAARYRSNDPNTMEAVRRLAAAYCFTPGVSGSHSVNLHQYDLEPHPDQAKAYADIERHRDAAKQAMKKGNWDGVVSGLEGIKPDYFEGMDEAGKRQHVQGLTHMHINGAADSALEQVIHNWRMDQNPKMKLLEQEILNPSRDGQGRPEPTVVFAHNLATARAIRDHLTAQGFRVGHVEGSVDKKKRDLIRKDFQGELGDEPGLDVLTVTDAGTTSQNLQRSKNIVQWDTPWVPKDFNQRNGRGDRNNRVGDLHVHHLRVKFPGEQHRIDVMEGKNPLSDTIRNSHHGLDDNGLLGDIYGERAISSALYQAAGADGLEMAAS